MTTTRDPDRHSPHLDRQARQMHATALASVSPRTLARLRESRRAAAAAATAGRRPALASWLAGGALAASLALAVILLPGHPAPGPASAPATTIAATNVLVEPLQEDPGFYLWLESADATALAME